MGRPAFLCTQGRGRARDVLDPDPLSQLSPGQGRGVPPACPPALLGWRPPKQAPPWGAWLGGQWVTAMPEGGTRSDASDSWSVLKPKTMLYK